MDGFNLSYLNFDGRKGFAVVNTNHGSNHLRHNNHVSKVRLDNVRLLVHRSFLLSLAKLAKKRSVLARETTREAAADSAVQNQYIYIYEAYNLISYRAGNSFTSSFGGRSSSASSSIPRYLN